MEAAKLLEELAVSLRLATRSATVLLLVGEAGRSVEEARAPLLALLRARGPFQVEDLGTADPKLGPRGWAERTPAGSADAFVLVVEPGSPLAARTFGRRLNGEREHLRRLGGPLLILVNADDERALRQIAPDFFTWVAATYELPPAGELLAHARKNAVVVVEGGASVSAEVTIAPGGAIVPPVRFLHLSDIHFRTGAAKTYDRSKVLQGLLSRLRKDRDKSPLDLLFFTGDLAFAGDPKEYEAAVAFLRELLDATSLDRDHLFVVPGNHDVDRKVGRWALRTLGSEADATDFFVEAENRRLHKQKFAAYRRAVGDLLGEARPIGLRVGGDAVELVEVRGVKLAVASFNSAWFAVDEEDVEKLWLGEANVRLAAERIEGEAGVTAAIALMHHPTEYLAEAERSTVENLLERAFDVVLRGHLHRDKAKSVITGRGGYVELAAPAAYQGSQWPNGCFVGEIQPSPRALRVRAYKLGAGADPWTPDHAVFPDDEDGSHTFHLRERRHGSAIAGTFTTMVTGSIVGAMAAGDHATAFGDFNVDRISPKEAVTALDSSGGRLPEHIRKSLVERLAREIPPPPELPVHWGLEAFERMLHRLLDYWKAHRADWLEALGDNDITYQLIAGAFFERQSGQPVSYPNTSTLLIGGVDGKALVRISHSASATTRALRTIVASDAPHGLGAVLWFKPDRPREDMAILRESAGGGALWVLSL
jgi:3',5'-cyclic AMP phosphodiesterase CpdA